MSFPANREFFQLSEGLNRCLWFLSVRGIGVTRVQIKDGICVIEIKKALPSDEFEIETVNGYQRTQLTNCNVIWKGEPK